VIVGLGVDVCSIDRMRKALERHGERFFARICSEAERKDLHGREQATALAGRFAVKEAFAKALQNVRAVSMVAPLVPCAAQREALVWQLRSP